MWTEEFSRELQISKVSDPMGGLEEMSSDLTISLDTEGEDWKTRDSTPTARSQEPTSQF